MVNGTLPTNLPEPMKGNLVKSSCRAKQNRSSSFWNRVWTANLMALGAAIAIAPTATAQESRLPEDAGNRGLSFQTSGPALCASIGDWYTSLGLSAAFPTCAGNPANVPAAPSNAGFGLEHRFSFTITAADLATAGGSVVVQIEDAEIARTPPGVPPDIDQDEIRDTDLADPTTVFPDAAETFADPTRFRLFNDTTGAEIPSTNFPNGIVPSGSANGQTLAFQAVTTPGTYTLTSQTGAFYVQGGVPGGIAFDDIRYNDDDNGYTIVIAGVDNLLIGQLQGSLQLRRLTSGSAAPPSDFRFYVLVGPGTGELDLRNFDIDDATVSVDYISPGGNTLGGTKSSDATWNGGAGTLNTGSDNITGLDTQPNGVSTLPDAGAWTIAIGETASLNRGDQFILEARSDSALIPVIEPQPQQAGNFVITPDTTLATEIGIPVNHEFTVTNQFLTTDIVNLATTGTDPNYTVELLDAAGNPLPDSDQDGVPDTGILARGETRTYILRATPNTGATGPDTTVITGTSFMDRRIRAQANNGLPVPQSVTKITTIGDPGFTLTETATLTTQVGVPVNHPFTVTNTGSTEDVINLTTSGTDPNYTVTFIDPATGQPVPDTNGDGIPDTGSLPPGGVANLILQVTPLNGTVLEDTTTVTGTSVRTGATQSVDKTTRIGDDVGNLALYKGITRVFRAATGIVETYNNPLSPPNIAGFVGTITPNPEELQSGDLVEYAVYYQNDSTVQITNAEICDPIPAGTSFVRSPGSSAAVFQDLYSGERGISFDTPAALPLGNGSALSNVFDGDQGEIVSPLSPRASCPNENAGNNGAVVVRIGTVGPGQVGFVKFVTQVN